MPQTMQTHYFGNFLQIVVSIPFLASKLRYTIRKLPVFISDQQ